MLYVIGLRYSYRAYQVRSYSFRPNPRDLQEYSANHSAEDTWRAVAEQCVLSIEANEEWLSKKAEYLYSALAVLPMQAAALTIATVIALFAR